MTHHRFDEQMEALDALKGRELDAASIALVRKALSHKSNFLVAKAARLAEENQLADFVPDLRAAFDRFFVHPEKTDPQCWAKNALSRALSRLECRDKDVFLRGLHFRQLEPTWGGRSDSAATVRANCAHALIACDGLAPDELLLLLLDLLADEDKSVRVEAVRAIGQLSHLAVSVLRLRALLPGEDPEVLSMCFHALLEIHRESGIPFVARFLAAGDGAAAEAAFALAETHSPAALSALLAQRDQPAADPWFRGVLLSAIALTRRPQAFTWLIGLIEREDRDAPLAIEALAKSSPNPELRARIEKAANENGSPRLRKALEEHLPPA